MTTFADRYRSGQLFDVWTAIVGLGEGVRENVDLLSDVEAVGREIMRRSRHNVERLIVELPKLGYVFEPGEGLDVYTPPSADIRSELDEIEARVGTMPLALRWWLEDVGTVNLMGHHPDWTHYCPDPLVVEAPAAYIVGGIEVWEEDLGTEWERRPFTIDFSPDHLHKANISGGAPYALAVPCAAADALVLWERHQTTFVNLLRVAFRHGGFLGYDINADEENATLPQALTELGSSLESI